MKTIILGIGNPLLGDDGIGVHIAHLLKDKVQSPSVKVDEAFTGGMNLLDLIRGYERAILIDTIHRQDQPVGSIARYDLSDLPTQHSLNPHDTSLAEAITLAHRLGDTQIPSEILIYGITVHEICTEFSEELSQTLKDRLPSIISRILKDIQSMNN
jgi:hydrogenase maturation protease